MGEFLLRVFSLSELTPLITDQDKQEESLLCSNQCGFFGRAETSGMCSKCYKEVNNKKERDDLMARPSPQVNAARLPLTAPSPLLPTPSAQQQATATIEEHDPAEVKKAKTTAADKSRCAECKKKVGLTAIECRCGNVYCGTHRLAEKHMCTFDFKQLGRSTIEKQNEKVVAERFEKL